MKITVDNYGRVTQAEEQKIVFKDNQYRMGWVSAKGFFGSAPIRAEGQPVAYDQAEICEVEAERDHYECEKNVDFDGGSYDAELDDA